MLTPSTTPTRSSWTLIVDALAELGRAEIERRVRAGILAADEQADDESRFTAAMRQASDEDRQRAGRCGDDD